MGLSLVYYHKRVTPVASVLFSPAVVAFSHESISGHSSIIIGIDLKDVGSMIHNFSFPHPRLVASAILGAKMIVDNTLEGKDVLDALLRLDHLIYNINVSPSSSLILASLLRGLGFDVRVFLYNEPLLGSYNRVVSAVKRPAKTLNEVSKAVMSKCYDVLRSSARIKSVEEEFYNLLGYIEDIATYDFEIPNRIEPYIDFVVEFGNPIFSIHDFPDVEGIKIPYLAHTRTKYKRVTLSVGISKSLNPLMAQSSMVLFDRRTYAAYRFFTSLILTESPIGSSQEYVPLGFKDEFIRPSTFFEPGILYGVIGYANDPKLYDTFLDQLNDQTIIPAFIKDGRLIRVSPRMTGAEYLYLEAFNYNVIEDIISNNVSEDKEADSNFFFGFLINTRRFMKTGRYLGEPISKIKRRSRGGEARRLFLGKYMDEESSISVTLYPQEEPSLYTSIDDIVCYVKYDKRPSTINVDECIERGKTAVYLGKEELIGRCADEAYDLFDRDPFLLRCLEDNDMDVERRLAPTVTAFLLGIYSLFKPRAYIQYQYSPVNPQETTLKFVTESFSAFSRSPAGATSLIIALIILLARIIGPKIYGDRPTAYLALVSLGLTFYLGAIIGLFSREYDYLFLLKYATGYSVENAGKFMMYTVTIGEGGRALIVGLAFLVVAFILDAYHSRKG